MKDALIIELVNLPEEGKDFVGEIDPALFNLPKHDAKPAGPLYYDLTIQRFENELLVRGVLSTPFKFTCSRDNTEFIQTISIENFGQSYEIEDGTMNLNEALREEVLMKFPSYPNCENADDPHTCKIEERYLAVDKHPDHGVDEAPQSTSDNQWEALDQLDEFKD